MGSTCGALLVHLPLLLLLLFGHLIYADPNGTRCQRGFQKVLSSQNCNYYAYGPQFMTSYCSWDQQNDYGVTSKFCCSGVCAFCFQSLDSTSDEESMSGVEGNGSGVENPESPPSVVSSESPPDLDSDYGTDFNDNGMNSLGELLAKKLKRMIVLLDSSSSANRTAIP